MACRLVSFREIPLLGEDSLNKTNCISSFKSCQKEKENGKSLIDCSWVKTAMFPNYLLIQTR